MTRSKTVPWVALLALMVSAAADAGGKVHSYALVQEDGSLRIQGRLYRLHGIYIPDTPRRCRTFLRPVRCAPRAALALDFKIRRFVTCEPLGRNEDGSIDAVCHVGRNAFSQGEDLAAYLLTMGWAVALPQAPFEYHVLEKIARRQDLGIWGRSADSVIRRPGEPWGR